MTGALLVMAGGLDAATYASTGDSLILGRVNHAGSTTTLATDHNAPALRLRTGNGAPMQVSSPSRVANLNADRVDGKDAQALGVTTREYGLLRPSMDTSYHQTLPGLKLGKSYLVSYSIVASYGEEPTELAPIQCAIAYADNRPGNTAWAYGTPVSQFGGAYTYVAATGIVDVIPEVTPSIWCQSSAPFAVDADDAFGSYVLFTSVNRHEHGVADPPRTRR